jgi:hypothetical protein
MVGLEFPQVITIVTMLEKIHKHGMMFQRQFDAYTTCSSLM